MLSLFLTAFTNARGQQPPVLASHNVTPKPEDVKQPSNSNARALAGIRIRVRDAQGKPLARKRFYVLKSSAEGSALDWSGVPARESYLKNASAPLKQLFEKYDCDTIYCPEFEAEFETAKEIVPEFRQSYAEGLRRYKNPRLALRWMTVNFPLKEARLGFYERKKAWLAEAERKCGAISSVMTDERGDAYFINVPTGSYYISNLIPLAAGSFLWDAPVTVPPLLPGKLHSVSVELIAKAR